MSLKRFLTVILSTGGLAFIVCLSQAQEPPKISPPSSPLNLQPFLPSAADLQGWTPKDAPQHYAGEDLYLYIDGGAELYHEYGFKQVVAQDYRNTPGKVITLEIFEMADSECAYGMFSFKSSGKGKPYAIGQDARLEDYYLNFWKGPCLVTLTGSDGGPESIQGILRIAEAVDAKIPMRGSRPSLVGILPQEWAGTSRQVYLRGVLGLNNIHPFFAHDVFRFKEALAAEQDQFKIFIFKYADAEEAKRRFQEVKDALARSPFYKNIKSPKPDNIETTDAKGNKLYIQVYKDHISLILTDDKSQNGQTISDMFDRLNGNLPAPKSI